MLVVVTGKDLEARGLSRYLYNGQTVVTAPFPTEFSEAAVIHSDDDKMAEYLRDRLSSGLFGARLVASTEEADAYIKDELLPRV